MSLFRVIMISDPHLSRERPYFQYNWEIIVDEINKNPPDAVLFTGDICLNGHMVPDDLDYGVTQLKRIKCPVWSVPGNHDVGNNIPSENGGPEISIESREKFLQYFKEDYWAKTIHNWCFIGLNTMLFNSNFLSEKEQLDFLIDTIVNNQDKNIVICGHKPFFHLKPETTEKNQYSIFFEQRKDLLTLLEKYDNIKLVITGHVHVFELFKYKKTDMLWLTSSGFVTDMDRQWWNLHMNGIRRVGYHEVLFDDNSYEVRLIEPLEMINYDVGNWLKAGMGGYMTATTENYRGYSV